MAYLNITSVRSCTESEGPGKRFALWVQGCNRRCPGCCNPEMQPIIRAHIVEAKDIIPLMEHSAREYGIEGISLIGGEPVLQAEGLAEISRWAKSEGLSVLLFTGFTLEELRQKDDPHVNELLTAVDILVDGPYMRELPDEKRDWVGSVNQRVHFLTDRYAPGNEYAAQQHQMELLVSDNQIMFNGWPFM
jgi:Pyruvate-formate lyase-activating enzyme